MELSKVLMKIKELKTPVFQTRDIAALLNQSITTTSKSLARLANNKHLLHLHRGVWAITESIQPIMLPNYLLAPFPCYISLQSALYHHGMIEQIPEIIYVVSCDRTKVFHTPVATVSAHHIPPALFFSYIMLDRYGTKIATPEKALFDFLYLKPGKTRLFTKLPELNLPRNFKRKLFLQWLAKVNSPSRRSMMNKDFKHLLSEATSAA